MLGIPLKRSAATLGVVAGLLAAAGPASAGTQVGSEGVKQCNAKAVVVLIGANDYGFVAKDTQASLGRENSIEC